MKCHKQRERRVSINTSGGIAFGTRSQVLQAAILRTLIGANALTALIACWRVRFFMLAGHEPKRPAPFFTLMFSPSTLYTAAFFSRPFWEAYRERFTRRRTS